MGLDGLVQEVDASLIGEQVMSRPHAAAPLDMRVAVFICVASLFGR